jgi:beta-galactosidase
MDYMMAGTGSGSCGPALAEKYRIPSGPFTFTFRIKPVFFEEINLSEELRKEVVL